MIDKNLTLNSQLYEYLLAISLREEPILRKLREETASLPMARMQVPPEQGQFLAFLIKLMQARKVLEIGVFTGYSSTAIALALPEGGKLVACDIDEQCTDIARRYWQEARISNKIELHVAPAQETLARLIDRGETNTFDFAFIDADKSNYDLYYEQSLKLVRRGGLIVVDNVLWSGRVADSAIQDRRTQSIRAFNQKLAKDERIALSLLPVADGLTLALKK